MFDETFISNDFVTLTLKDFLLRLAVTLGIGLVLGLERENVGIRDKHQYFAGIRTFTIVALLGFLSGLISGFIGTWIIYLSFIGIIALTTVSYVISGKKGDIGATTEFALILNFLLGLTTVLGYVQLALVITVLILALLSLKLEMKMVAGVTTREEIFALLKFAILVALILPFLPDKTIDPYNIFNPREVMVVIILTSGLNFGGYLLVKFLGAQKGILLTGIVGGFVSSTIITWNFSKKSSENAALSKSYSSAILFASTIMPVRVILWIYIFNKAMLAGLALPLLLLVATGVLYAFILMKKNSDRITNHEISSENPLDLIAALKFGGVYTLILYAVHFASVYFGSKGILIASAVSGLSDVDAITISLAKMRDQSLASVISNGILIATLSNTIVKLVIAMVNGSKELKKHMMIGYGLIFLAGVAGFVILNFFGRD